jgi:hypothetical protein
MQVGKKEVILDYFKILSDWKIEEVLLDIYHRNTGIPELELQRLDMDSFSLPEPCPQLSVEELNNMVEELRMRKDVFKDV